MEIRHALGLDKIAVEYYSWRSTKMSRVLSNTSLC